MIRTKGRRRLTCFHEAGHCLARWYFGYPIERVVVLTVEQVRAGVRIRNPRGELVTCEGMVVANSIDRGLPPETFANLTRDGLPAPELAAAMMRRVVIQNEMALVECSAGYMAEAIYSKSSATVSALFGGDGDLLCIKGTLDTWLPGREEEQRKVTLLAERRAVALVRSKPGWAAVTAVADALMARGRLTGAQVARLCRAAYGGREAAFGAWFAWWPPTLEQLRAGFIPNPALPEPL